jgi:hypothetical protein
VRLLIAGTMIFSFVATSAVFAGNPPPGVPTVSHPEAYKGLTKEGIAKINAGEIIILKEIKQEEKPSGVIEAALVYNQPIDKVWYLIVDRLEDQCKFLPHLDKSDLALKRGNHYIMHFHLTILGIEINWYVDHVAEKDKYFLQWELDPNYKNDIKAQRGYWRLYWLDEKRTLARYGTWFSIGIPVPKFIQSFLIKRDLPRSLGNMKKFVDSGGTWQKPEYKGT